MTQYTRILNKTLVLFIQLYLVRYAYYVSSSFSISIKLIIFNDHQLMRFCKYKLKNKDR